MLRRRTSGKQRTFSNPFDDRLVVATERGERLVFEVQLLHDPLPDGHAVRFADAVAAALEQYSVDHNRRVIFSAT